MLTEREREALQLAAHGFGNRRIAKVMGVCEKTVKNHLMNAYIALGVQGTERLGLCPRVCAIRRGVQEGLIQFVPLKEEAAA